MSQYTVVETFYSLQGEGINTGKPFYFIRLAGCHVGCIWCDTKKSWNKDNYPQYSAKELLEIVLKSKAKTVIITGGEPLLHDLTDLCRLLKDNNIYIAVETSGIGELSGFFDWVTLSPKKHNPPDNLLMYQKANELKIIISQEEDFAFAEENARKVNSNCKLLLQPQWQHRQKITPLTIDYIKAHPHWQLSIQTHKYIDIQ